MQAAEASPVATGLKQCRQAQDQLEDAIAMVMKAETQLRDNAREVRVDLQSSVSRQQEALRCREVWLLDQIQILEQVHTETLQHQLHQLHRLRGQFDVIFQQLQNNNNNKDLNQQLTCCMEKLSSMSLTPEETPDISFHADARSLKQAITSFGSITAQLVAGVSSQSPAPQRGQVSCPITAKKQKVEAAALGNWLLGTPPASSAPIGYQSSKNPQDWLMAHKESKTSCPALASVDFLQAWGQLRDLEAWLQTGAPGNRERTDSNCSSEFSIEKIDESDLTVQEAEEEEEEEEGLNGWLITPATVSMETESDGERWRGVLAPFQAAWEARDWLCAAPRPADCSACCQTAAAPPLEIENLGLLKCLKVAPNQTPTPAPSQTPTPAPSQTPTLAPSAPPTPAPTPGTLESWLQQAAPLQKTCRANEICSSYADCVCEQNCGRDALSVWLLRQDGRDKNGVPVATPTSAKNVPPTLHRREQEQKVQAILEAWLHPPTHSSGEEKAAREESLFQTPLDPDLWVVPRQTPPHPADAQEDKWLLRKRTQAQERLSVCELFSCMKLSGDKDKWLHTSQQM